MKYQMRREDLVAFASTINAETKEKGKELIFKLCPYCNGGDSHDKETFSVNIENGAFNCFRAGCGKHGHFVELARDFGYALDFGDSKPKKQYRRLAQKEIVVRSKAVEYLESRGISKETAERYKITTRKDNDNILVFPFYDEKGVMVAAKYRNTKFVKGVDKNKEFFESDTKPVLFGMMQASDKTKPLIITEGQLDSLSIADCGIPNAVSVPNGANGSTWQSLCYDWVMGFPEIIIFGDGDEPGQTMVERIIKGFPNAKIKNVRKIDYLGEKDANDILRAYGKQAIINCVSNAEVIDVDAVKPLQLVKNVDISSMPKAMTGISEIDKAIGGMYFGQLIVLTGKRGDGKSTLASNICANVLEQNYNIFVYSGELPDYHFKNWLDKQIAGKEHADMIPNQYGGYDYYISDYTGAVINSWYADRAYIYDNTVVYRKGTDEIPTLLETIERAVCRYGINFVLIDNLMTAISLDSDDIYLEQGKFIKNLKSLALKMNIVILLVAHPRKENRDDLGNDSVSGTSVITNMADVVLTYSRNKGDDAEQYQSLIGIPKNRLFGKVLMGDARIKVKYSEISKRIGGKSDNLNRVYSCFESKSASKEATCEPPF